MESSICAVLLILTQVLLWVVLSKVVSPRFREVIFIIVSFVCIWLFLVLSESYSDMLVYEKYFRSLNPGNFGTTGQYGWEILFKVLLFGIRLFTDNSYVMRCLVAIITLAGPFCFIKRYSKNYLLSVVMFIALGSFYMQFFILRQAIAISIFLIAFHFITDRKIIKYCLLVIVAALFHKSAIVLIILYPLANIPPSRVKTVTIRAIAAVSLLLSPLLTRLLTAVLYKGYVDGAFGEGMYLLAFYMLMYVAYMVLGKKTHSEEKREIVDTALFTIFWQIFAIQNSVFCRMANYARDSFCILIPNSACQLSGKRKILFSAVVIGICIGFILVTKAFSWYNVIK